MKKNNSKKLDKKLDKNKKNVNKKNLVNNKFSKIRDWFRSDKFKDIINSKMFMVIVMVLMSFSISLLSLYLMIGKVTEILKYITLLVSFMCSYIYLNKNYKDIFKMIRDNKIYSIISLIFSMIIFYELMRIPLIDEVKLRFFNISWFYYFIFPGLSLVFTIFFIWIKEWFIKFFKRFLINLNAFEVFLQY